MSSNPSEFARRVLSAFEAVGLATDEEVGDAGGPSTTTLAKYRKVANDEMTMAEPRGDVLQRIDAAAGWASGSARALWRQGREPEPATHTDELLNSVRTRRPTTVKLGDPAHLRWLGERITEVEERMDLILERLDALSEEPSTLRSVAKPGDIEPEDGDLNVP